MTEKPKQEDNEEKNDSKVNTIIGVSKNQMTDNMTGFDHNLILKYLSMNQQRPVFEDFNRGQMIKRVPIKIIQNNICKA